MKNTEDRALVNAISRLTWTQRALSQAEPPRDLRPDFEWLVLHQQIKHARLFLMSPELLVSVYAKAQAQIVEPIVYGSDVEVPTALPFECVFLTPDIDEHALYFDIEEEKTELFGFVLSLRSKVFRAWMVTQDLQGLPIFMALCTTNKWRGSSNLASLVVPPLVSILNQQPIVASTLSFSHRRHWQQSTIGLDRKTWTSRKHSQPTQLQV